jgi:hypothetical protein
MYRLIARVLLLIAVVSNLAPLALTATAPAHACCVRKSVHPCHGSDISEIDRIVIRDGSCCNQGCGRALTTSWRADSSTSTSIFAAQAVEPYFSQSTSDSPYEDISRLQSPRGPPQFSISN